jgi:methionyl-tRNA formyltransferase
MHARESCVKIAAKKKSLPIAQPITLKDPVISAMLREHSPDAMVVAAYGLILPTEVLNVPVRGCINIHASLLPRWRGAAPIQRALLAGDSETGITIMQMNAGLDTGDILLTQAMPISNADTAGSLHNKLASAGGRCIVRALSEDLVPVPQNNAAATYAEKITKSESIIDWSLDAETICRRVRAYNPVPGAMTTFEGDVLKIWQARPLAHTRAHPGTILSSGADGIHVASGDAAVQILELQKAGGKQLPAGAFLAGTRLLPGARLGANA